MIDATSCKLILVVEDDVDIRNMLALALEVEGYNVACAANGKEGLEVLEKVVSPCLILLDLMMPIMNGQEFLKVMRKDDILAVIPIVVVSVFSDQAKDENVQGIMKKPIDLETLLNTVRKYCDHRITHD